MRALLQRVSGASVLIDTTEKQEIGCGLVVLVGIEEADSEEDIIWLIKKIMTLRIFRDVDGKMNLSVKDIDGDLLVVSQFTLHASTRKGNRPSFIKAAKPEQAVPLYLKFIEECKIHFPKGVRTGKFGANMEITLTNDGPVTIWLDSKNRE